jgi:hypothetical protein
MPTRSKRTEYNITPEQFVTAWEQSESADEVAKRLKMPKPIVLARASSYRHAGVKLKKMKRKSTRGLSVDALNAVIDRLHTVAHAASKHG